MFRHIEVTLRGWLPVLLCAVFLPACSVLTPPRAKDPVGRAAAAWLELSRKDLKPGERQKSLDRYHHAVAQVVEEWSEDSPRHWPSARTVPRKVGVWTVRIDMGQREGVWSPALLDEIELAKEGQKPEAAAFLRSGIGVPVVAGRKRTDDLPDREFVPSRGQFFPTTAVLDFDARMQPTLRLYDPRVVRTLAVGKSTLPLAADFWTPAHATLRGQNFVRSALGGLVRPERFLKGNGLFLMEPYHRDKIPVVFVHGLISDQHIWEGHLATLMADPELGPRIQCWYFVYPTGLPVLSSGTWLRDALHKLEEAEDPDHDDPGPKKMLFVTHSMGGLITRLQVIDSGDSFWRTWFVAPPEKLRISPAYRKMLMKNFFFESNPDIRRVVFIATPHRGSQVADSWVGRTVSSLIRAPQDLMKLVTAVLTVDMAMVDPRRRDLARPGLDSIHSLSPEHPLVAALESRPIRAKYHSIIGRIGKKPDLRDTSDGVVPYWSSHLEGAESEIVVPFWHGCVERPETVREVHRITRLHVLSR